LRARIAPTCAIASQINTPGITGRLGKCPGKNGSLIETFFIPTIFSDKRKTMRDAFQYAVDVKHDFGGRHHLP
jgi:hypothetical protein